LCNLHRSHRDTMWLAARFRINYHIFLLSFFFFLSDTSLSKQKNYNIGSSLHSYSIFNPSHMFSPLDPQSVAHVWSHLLICDTKPNFFCSIPLTLFSRPRLRLFTQSYTCLDHTIPTWPELRCWCGICDRWTRGVLGSEGDSCLHTRHNLCAVLLSVYMR
jgi:hypothetical protein